MTNLAIVLLGVTFAVVNVVAILHGRSWDRSGTGWSWHLPVVFLAGGGGFVAQSYLSRLEAGHLLVAALDGVLVAGTVVLLAVLFRESTTRVQWAGVFAVLAGVVLIQGSPPAGPEGKPPHPGSTRQGRP